MKKILGFDPGTARLGFGVLESDGQNFIVGDYGVIETAAGLPKAERLRQIQADLRELLAEVQPDIVAVEELFFVNNITTGIAVAEARGVILATVAELNIEIVEYKPNQIKMAVCGSGNASKDQMQRMVQVLLGLAEIPKPDDSADALAVALTCAQIPDQIQKMQ